MPQPKGFLVLALVLLLCLSPLPSAKGANGDGGNGGGEAGNSTADSTGNSTADSTGSPENSTDTSTFPSTDTSSSVSFELSLGVGVSLTVGDQVSFSQSLQLLSDQISYTLGRPPPPRLPFEEIATQEAQLQASGRLVPGRGFPAGFALGAEEGRVGGGGFVRQAAVGAAAAMSAMVRGADSAGQAEAAEEASGLSDTKSGEVAGGSGARYPLLNSLVERLTSTRGLHAALPKPSSSSSLSSSSSPPFDSSDHSTLTSHPHHLLPTTYQHDNNTEAAAEQWEATDEVTELYGSSGRELQSKGTGARAGHRVSTLITPTALGSVMAGVMGGVVGAGSKQANAASMGTEAGAGTGAGSGNPIQGQSNLTAQMVDTSASRRSADGNGGGNGDGNGDGEEGDIDAATSVTFTGTTLQVLGRQLAIQLSIGFTASIAEAADVNLDATLEGLQQQIQAALGPLAARRQALQLLTGGGGSGSSEGEPQG